MFIEAMVLVDEDCYKRPLSKVKRTRRNKVKGITNPKIDTKLAIKRFKAVHGNKYKYDRVEYKNNHTDVWVGCRVHGYFEQNPSSHWLGYGCSDCGTRPRKNNTKREKVT